MKRKLVLALGCLALLVAFSGAAMAEAISFTFLGVHTTPAVVITRAGGVNLTSAPLLAISDTNSNNVFIVPGLVNISTGPANTWTVAGNTLSAAFDPGAGIEVQVDSVDCVGGAMPGVCLQGTLNTNGAYFAFLTGGKTGSFQGVFTVTYVSPWVPALFGDPLPWLPQGSDSFNTSHNALSNHNWTDTGLVGAGAVTYSPVPEPGTLALLGTGVLGLASLIRRKLQ